MSSHSHDLVGYTEVVEVAALAVAAADIVIGSNSMSPAASVAAVVL